MAMVDPENRVHCEEGPVDIVVLMAGKGRRLLPLTADRPKSLLICEDGISIFGHIVRSFASFDWSPTIIPVVGHGYRKVYEVLGQLGDQVRCTPVTNPFYATAGPLVSLWLGLLRSNSEKVVILNGDTIIREALVAVLARWLFADTAPGEGELGACVTLTDQFKPDDMKVLLDEDGCFGQAGKEITPGAGVVKSAGVIALKSAAAKNALRGKLEELLMTGSGLKAGFYWHNILNEIKNLLTITLIEVAPGSWYEVDTSIDLLSIEEG